MRKIISIILWLTLTNAAVAADKITIISPHRRSIQQEFIPVFKTHYKKKYKTEIEVSWLDQGGTSDDIRFVRAKYAKNPKTSGIDIFWGGGAATFIDLNRENTLAKYSLPPALKKQIPQRAAGALLYDKTESWHATALSSFGIFYNKQLIKMDKIPAPTTWANLAEAKYFGNLSLTDPRRSGTATMINNIILQSLGWEKGWNLLTSIAGNTKKFTHSSSDPIKAVVAGDVACALAIDFYANAKIADLGAHNLGFTLPAAQTVIDPDPIAILKGAPNRKAAERFVDFILSPEAQKILLLPKGKKGGPKLASLGRMAVNTKAYEETKGQRTSEINPFELKSALDFDSDKAATIQRILGDLIGSVLIDTHRELKSAWKVVIKRGSKPAEVAAIGKMPLSEKTLLEYTKKWNDNVFRNKIINEWTLFARSKYKRISAGNF